MSRHTVPADVHKCPGVGSDADGWREGCDDCLRRIGEPAMPDRVWWMSPPAVVVFWCEAHIPVVSSLPVDPPGQGLSVGASAPADAFPAAVSGQDAPAIAAWEEGITALSAQAGAYLRVHIINKTPGAADASTPAPGAGGSHE